MPPVGGDGRTAAGYPYPDEGMSLRDWFAGQALAGTLGALTSASRGSLEAVAAEYGFQGNLYEFAALNAYGYADAMLAERRK